MRGQRLFTFLEIWREESLKSKPSDLALVTTLRDASYSRGVPGDLTFDSLNDALKEFLKLERACPPKSSTSKGPNLSHSTSNPPATFQSMPMNLVFGTMLFSQFGWLLRVITRLGRLIIQIVSRR